MKTNPPSLKATKLAGYLGVMGKVGRNQAA